jgi:hypothetical protein
LLQNNFLLLQINSLIYSFLYPIFFICNKCYKKKRFENIINKLNFNESLSDTEIYIKIRDISLILLICYKEINTYIFVYQSHIQVTESKFHISSINCFWFVTRKKILLHHIYINYSNLPPFFFVCYKSNKKKRSGDIYIIF